MGEKITGSNKCSECTEMINWEIKKYIPKEPLEDVGLVSYSSYCYCPKCKCKFRIDVGFDECVKFEYTGEKYNRKKEDFTMVNIFKGKTEEEIKDNLAEILIKLINQQISIDEG